MKQLIALGALMIGMQCWAQSAPPTTLLPGTVGNTGGLALLGGYSVTTSGSTYTLVPNEWWHQGLNIAGTATTIVAPRNIGQAYDVTNSESGPITFGGLTGTVVTIAAGATVRVKCSDGANYVQVGASSSGVTGSGTPNTIPKFTGTGTIGNSSITDNATTINTNEPFAAGSLTSEGGEVEILRSTGGNGGILTAVEGTASTVSSGVQGLEAISSTHTVNIITSSSSSPICTVANGLCGGGGAAAGLGAVQISATGGALATAIGDVNYQSPISTPAAANVASPLTVQANSVFDQNCNNKFTDGTQYCSAGPVYASFGEFIDDQTLACMGNPAKCPASLLLNTLTKFDANFSGSLGYPTSVLPSGGVNAQSYCSGFDLSCGAGNGTASGDGRIMVPENLYLYCLKTGIGSSACTAEYTALVAHIKAAWALVPRNGSTHLYTVPTGPGTGVASEFVCGTEFMEYMRNTGAVANCNVWAAIDDAEMLKLATAAGDATNVTFFTNDLALLVAGIRANLIDGTSGLLIAATIQDSTNLDVVSSSLAIAADSSPVMAPPNILTSGQKTTIENYFDTNFSTLTNAAGYILQSPTEWAIVGTIPTTGGPPYTSTATPCTGNYQCGFWSFTNDWFSRALGVVDQPKVETLLGTFLNSVDPGCEYFARGASTCSGTTPNLESPQWAVATNITYPLAPTVTAGVVCGNLYGAPVNSGCSSGGLPNPYNLTTTQVFAGSPSLAVVTSVTGANTSSVGQVIANTSTGGHGTFWFQNGSGAPTPLIPCGGFFDTVASVALAQFCPSGFSVPSGETIGFNPSNVLADTAFSRIGAASVALGNGTAGNTSGTLSLNQLNTVGLTVATTVSGNGVAGTYTPSGADSWLFPYVEGSTGAGPNYLDALNNTTSTVPFSIYSHGGLMRVTTASTGIWGWTASGASDAAADTGLSRDSAGVVDVGNGTAGNKSGTLNAATGTFGTALTVGGNTVCQSTGTNCPSVAVGRYQANLGTGSLTPGNCIALGSSTFPGGSSTTVVSGSFSNTASGFTAAEPDGIVISAGFTSDTKVITGEVCNQSTSSWTYTGYSVNLLAI